MLTQAYILLKTFGLDSLQPKVIQKEYSIEKQNLPDYTTTGWGQSYLGTPVFAPFAFEDGNYEKNKEIIKYAGIRLDTALIDVSLEKNIVRTQIQGRNTSSIITRIATANCGCETYFHFKVEIHLPL